MRCRLCRAAALAAAFGHVLHIAAGAEGAAGAGQDHHFDRRVAGQSRQAVQQSLHDRRRQRVQPLRPIKGQRRYSVLDVLDQV